MTGDMIKNLVLVTSQLLYFFQPIIKLDFLVLKLVYRKSCKFLGQIGLRSHILTHEEITVNNKF